MKKIFSIVMSVVFLLVMAAFAAPKSNSMTGWISDSKCKKTGEKHASCAKSCVQHGEKAVFVDDKSGNVYPIANQDAVKDHVGDHVKVTASEKDGSLEIAKVSAAK